MRRMVSMLYALFAYALFLGYATYGIGFVGDLYVTRSLDAGDHVSLPAALAIDLALLGFFALQHSVMARPSFKKHWTKLIPQHLERSTFIIAAGMALTAIYVHWQPIPSVLWHIDGPFASALLWSLFFTGWGLLLASTFMIDHTDLLGLKQAYCYFRKTGYREPAFTVPSLYKYVRHPQYLGILVAFWATPHMTLGHLLFAAVMTVYARLGIVFEERDLIRTFGEVYRTYQKEVPMLLPFFPKRSNAARVQPGQ